MIGELLGAVNSPWSVFVAALVIFGFAPGFVLSLVVRLLHSEDPRRRELQAELYAVPRWERPFWVCEQFEVALREGLLPEVSWWWGRLVWHRSRLESGLVRHREAPDTFEIPSDEDKELLRPGDVAKLMWSVRRLPGERMWVTIINRDGDHLVATLSNSPVFVHMEHGETVKFHIDDIIDFEFGDEVLPMDGGMGGASAA